nr:uncharacterized protein LOC109182622 [Ipomoea trifida]
MKSEVRNLITAFCRLVENQFGSSVKCIRSDNGCEFNMDEFFSQKGIVHQTSCTYTPQQNSRVGIKHGHLLSTIRALRFQANLPEIFWGECILHATYIINKLPSAAINNQVPYQVLLKRVPQYQNLKVFGCLAYATIVSPKSKLDARAKKCVFLGCATATKGYKVYNIVSKELFLSRDVIFYENIFSFQQDTRQEGRVPQLILPTVNEVPIEMPNAIQPQNHVKTNTEQTCEQGSLNEQIYEQSEGRRELRGFRRGIGSGASRRHAPLRRNARKQLAVEINGGPSPVRRWRRMTTAPTPRFSSPFSGYSSGTWLSNSNNGGLAVAMELDESLLTVRNDEAPSMQR